MAASRPRRAHAGSRMAALLNDEEASLVVRATPSRSDGDDGTVGDEIYGTLYGGFIDEQDDDDYEVDESSVKKSVGAGEDEDDDGDDDDGNDNDDDDDDSGDEAVDSDGDIVDSDFSASEDDETRSDVEDDAAIAKRERADARKGRAGYHVKTKAYSEPKAKQARPSAEELQRRKVERLKQRKLSRLESVPLHFGRKEARASTLIKTAETAQRQKERVNHAKRLLVKKARRAKRRAASSATAAEDDGDKGEGDMATPVMTQEEILAEARLTEQMNMASLHRFREIEQAEEEKRQRQRINKTRKVNGSFVRYLSTTVGNCKAEDGEGDGREAKTFVTLSDKAAYDATIANARDAAEENRIRLMNSRRRKQRVCPITKLPAPYFDPVTQHPYANIQAFRILRQLYVDQLARVVPDADDVELIAWQRCHAAEDKSFDKPQASVVVPVTTTPQMFTAPGLVGSTPVAVQQKPATTTSTPPTTAAAAVTPTVKPVATASAASAALSPAVASLPPIPKIQRNEK